MIDEYRAKAFCCESLCNIENYEKAIADTTQTWHCHHRRECVDGVFTPAIELKEKDLYYKRPASELIFLTPFDHRSLHSKDPNVWIKLREGLDRPETKKKRRETLNRLDVRKKMGAAIKLALSNPDTRKKMSDAAKGRPAHNKGKKTSDETKKKISESTKLAMSDPAIKQKLCEAQNRPDVKKKKSEARIGRHLYTNGEINKFAYECPGEGWWLGFTKHKKSN